jgi:hypothetical protein
LLNLTLIVLQLVPPLCDYKVWIDTERVEEVRHHFRNMVEQNMMEEEIRARRLAEHKCAAYFAMKREMDHESTKRSERRRGHESVRKHDVRRKRMLKVVREH